MLYSTPQVHDQVRSRSTSRNHQIPANITPLYNFKQQTHDLFVDLQEQLSNTNLQLMSPELDTSAQSVFRVADPTEFPRHRRGLQEQLRHNTIVCGGVEDGVAIAMEKLDLANLQDALLTIGPLSTLVEIHG